MINKKSIEKFDISEMHKIYDKWPEIARDAYNSDLKAIDFLHVNHIVFAGMGGSGALGDIFAAILSKTNIHITIVKGYVLPKTVDENTLVVVTSISGNTQEMLSILKNAKEIKSNVIAFASGGKMENYCKENNLEFRKIEQFHSPRASFVSFLYTILKILEPVLPIDKNEIVYSIEELEKVSSKISSNNLTEENSSLQLAKWITDIPIIYYPFGFQPIAVRFKNSLQENSKIHAITEDVIEVCHNGIVSWEKNSSLKPIFIEGTDDHFKTKERWEILRELFDHKKIEYREIFSIGGGILSKSITLIYQLDYASIYLAILNETDPSPVHSIDFIKTRLSN